MASELEAVRSIALPDIGSDAAAAQSALAMAGKTVITSQEEYEFAVEDVKAIKARHKKLDEKRLSITSPLAAVTKIVNDLFRGPLTALEDAEKGYKRGMVRFVEAEAAKIRENERVAKLAAAAEREKQEAEAKRLQVEADALAAAGNATAAAEAQEQAAAVQQAAEIIVAVAPPAPMRTAGVSAPKTVDFEVASLAELVMWVAGQIDGRGELGEAALAYLQADEKAIRAQVRATGMKTSIGGVRVFEKTGIRIT